MAVAVSPYNPSMVEDPASLRRWVAQWRETGAVLAEMRREHLRRLSEEDALAATHALLSLADSAFISPSRRATSGLVQQQALLRRLRRP